MELYAKGQLSYLILTCMLDRDFYGLDIISEISLRSNGRINLKKPSVYSNLTRMEKQGYISSYLKSSDFGPNRKYYSLTEKGREFYNELKGYFERNNIDVFKDFDAIGVSSPTENFSLFENSKTDEEIDNSPAADLDQEDNEDNFFDFSSIDEEVHSQQLNEKLDIEEISENSQSSINASINEATQEDKDKSVSHYTESPIRQALKQHDETTHEKAKDDGVFLSQENADEYNKRIYDISKEINKYKKKRSFAEDQISMAATNPLIAAQEKSRVNIEDFKNSILNNKGKYQERRLNEDEFARQMNYRFDRTTSPALENKIFEEEIKNDAVYITERVNIDNLEKAKKIEPPRLQIVSEFVKENKLPAPNRDATIDPSHKEILTQLYSKTRDNVSVQTRDDAIYDFNDLRDFYVSQNIPFNIYKKPSTKIKHNTNKIYMIVSLITFLIASTLSVATYFTLLHFDYINKNTCFLYILLPALLLINLIIRIYHNKKFGGWIPKKLTPQWLVWLKFLLLSGAVVGLNFAFGLNAINFALYANTIIYPAAFLITDILIRYYAKRIGLIKFWK